MPRTNSKEISEEEHAQYEEIQQLFKNAKKNNKGKANKNKKRKKATANSRTIDAYKQATDLIAQLIERQQLPFDWLVDLANKLIFSINFMLSQKIDQAKNKSWSSEKVKLVHSINHMLQKHPNPTKKSDQEKIAAKMIGLYNRLGIQPTIVRDTEGQDKKNCSESPPNVNKRADKKPHQTTYDDYFHNVGLSKENKNALYL